jgi:transposase
MTSTILGIDIAKTTFHAVLVADDGTADRNFSNTAKGFATLATWLKAHRVQNLHACMEATGRYGDKLAHWLFDQGHIVSVVNPAAMHYYAKARLHSNKTDKVDAATIAEYCQREKPRAWTPPPPEVAELQVLWRLRCKMVRTRDADRNRLASGISSVAALALLNEAISFANAQIKQVETLIRDHIKAHPSLEHEYVRVRSIQGIGPIAGAMLVTLQLRRFPNERAAVAFTGLNPRIVESGSSVRRKTKISKRGDSRIRKTLYFPAINACTWNPIIKRQAARLAKAGKSNMAIIVAAMRKLVCLAYGVIKSDRPFDPNFREHAPAIP